jgi:cytochrome P450
MQPPGTGLTRAGAVTAYHRDPLGFLLGSARRHGPVVQLFPGTVMVTGRTEALGVLRATNREFFLDHNFLNRELAPDLDANAQRNWMSLRKAAAAQMTPERVSQHMTWFTGRAEAFAGQWLRLGTVTSLRRDLEVLTAESVARFCYGAAGDAEIPGRAQALLDALFPLFASPFRFPPAVRWLQPREWRVRRALRDFHASVATAAQAACPQGPADLASVLRESGIGGADLVRLLTSLVLAAHDVPASALASAVTELARDSRAQDAIAAAAATWDGRGRPPQQVGWFVDEVLRLWPPTWGLSRTAGEDAACGQWPVPPGTTVMMPLWVRHRVASCYRDPERFDPGRWAQVSPRAGDFLPFSAGPRWCPGERLARAEMAAVVAVLARRTRLRLVGEIRPDIRRTLSPAGFRLEVRPR